MKGSRASSRNDERLWTLDINRVTLLSQLGVCYALAAADTPGTRLKKHGITALNPWQIIKNIREDLKHEHKIVEDDQNIAQYGTLAPISTRLQEVDVPLRARALEDLMSWKYTIQKHNYFHALILDELSRVCANKGSSFLFLAILLLKLFSFVTKPSKIGRPYSVCFQADTVMIHLTPGSLVYC